MVSDCKMPSVKKGVMRYEHDGSVDSVVSSNCSVVVHRQSF